MKSITLTDLSHTEQLDAKAMAKVHGGMHMGLLYPNPAPVFDSSKHDFSIVADQLNSQTQNIGSNNGVNAAFAGDIRSKIKPTQTASNSISF